MSADNFIGIVWKNGRYIGFSVCASMSITMKDIAKHSRKVFETPTLYGAIQKAQQEHTEYGYTIFSFSPEDKDKPIKQGIKR